jgi:hypothetical protein
LVQQPGYPYHDICHPATTGTPKPDPFEKVPPTKYGHRDLVETDHPVDLNEAARRGSVASLEKMLNVKRRLVNRADPLGMTPLAWAVVHGRTEQAKVLLNYGASPDGETCARGRNGKDPVSLATVLKRRDMLALMQRRPLPARDLWLEKAYPDWRRSKKLALPKGITTSVRVTAKLLIGADGHIRRCNFGNACLDARAADELCHELQSKRVYFPGTDNDGNPVPQEIEQRLVLQPAES